MAKRRRLDPVPADGLSGAAPMGPLETKALFIGLPAAQNPTNAPIAAVAGDSALHAALETVTDAMSQARHEGRLALSLPLHAVDDSYLIRDRISADPEEMEALVASIRDRGQQTAIEVADLGPTCVPRYGLIAGWRRLLALRQIGAEAVHAIIRPRGDPAQAYQAMVEENEIRANLSFYERARIVARAADKGVFTSDKHALLELFKSAPRAKRSKVNSFLRIVRDLDGPAPVLRFPAALSEKVGLELSAALEREEYLAPRLRDALAVAAPTTAEAEAQVILAEVRRAPGSRAAQNMGPHPVQDLTPPIGDDPPGALPAWAPPPVPGLELIIKDPERLVLRGPTLRDPAFHRALVDWLVRAGWLQQ
jgi:ParB family transcriptional regulator, chromosome partitioning protein